MGELTNVPGGFPFTVDGEVASAVAAGTARSRRI
jgi:hypothetical protein